ncbi:MAG: hypothetical protein IPL50_13190 [Chitinophagaceae bacterium]|nr:hypothetical protein [Chitinophagaceae bacterium]
MQALLIPRKISDLYNKSLYLAYLKYTNNIIKNFVKNFNTRSRAIIIIMSDHGFYDYQNKGGYEPYNFDNICFLRLPGTKPDSSNLPRSNVNFFRYLFNTGLWAKPALCKRQYRFCHRRPGSTQVGILSVSAAGLLTA